MGRLGRTIVLLLSPAGNIASKIAPFYGCFSLFAWLFYLFIQA